MEENLYTIIERLVEVKVSCFINSNICILQLITNFLLKMDLLIHFHSVKLNEKLVCVSRKRSVKTLQRQGIAMVTVLTVVWNLFSPQVHRLVVVDHDNRCIGVFIFVRYFEISHFKANRYVGITNVFSLSDFSFFTLFSLSPFPKILLCLQHSSLNFSILFFSLMTLSHVYLFPFFQESCLQSSL